ncbi:hypothetical protein C5B96_12550 [Subtercola sp. Z020]|uniref:hypothetical protein n=1 Tax=Subtercola sp. Z020 TaxID=2080582 RepID=UPI000CE8355F|nr:hypothetical protein [Subtercola sp. Z020]PPF79540.1 hypothetical protein C5B96_12550 [Subtercola sp. Z020]
MGERAARALRGVLAAGFAVFVAAFSHVAVGGTAPGVVGLALGFAFAVLVCVGLAGRSLSVPRLSVAVGVSQLVFHCIFSLGAPSDVTALSAGHHGSVVTFATASGTGAAVTQGCDWMWAAHAIAAVLTVLALAKGERGIRALLAAAHLRLRRLVAAPFDEPSTPDAAMQNRAWLEPAGVHDLVLYLGSMRHRGPPGRRITTV